MRVRRFGFLFVIAVVVALVMSLAAAFAEAQYYHRNEVGGLVQGNLNMVRGLHYQLDRANMERQFHNLVFHDNYGYYGYYDNGGAFYAVADRQGRRLSRPVKIGIGAGIGAAFGYAVSGNAKGTAIGAGIGAIAGLIAGCDRGQQQYQPQSVAYTGGGQGHGQLVPAPMPEPAPAENPALIPEPVAEPEPQEQEQGEWALSNPTGFPLDVFDGQEFLGRMKTGEIWSVDAPRVGYRAEALIPNNHGGISRGKTDIRATDTGWEFVPPAVAGR